MAKWTKRLIPRLRPWIKRKHGRLNYTLAQFLSGHGVFREGLHKAKLVASAGCVFCLEVDTPEHAILHCKMFRSERQKLTSRTGTLTPDNIVATMLKSERNWCLIEAFVKAVILSKELWAST